MAEEPRPAALDRIDRAIARIETASRARITAHDALARRHDALRARVADAVTVLDGLIDPA